jgi:hypothetical protein
MSKIAATIKEEFLALLPPTIYFFVALHIIALIRLLMVKATGITPLTSASVLVASLVLGKSVLLADMLPAINRFPDKPLIYNVAWKALIYTAVAFVIHYLEHLYDYAREAGGIVAGNEKMLAVIIWPHFWAVQILLVVLIVLYCVMHELVRLIGRDKFVRMFFGPMPLPQA